MPTEDAFKGRGVSACATCDGFFFKNQPVAVIGGGNTAVEEALYLSNIASRVTVVHRRDEFRAEQIMINKLVERARSGNVEILWNHVLDEVVGNDSGVTGARLKSTKNQAPREIAVQGIFVAIGHTPNTKVFEGQLEMEGGYIVTRAGRKGWRPRRASRACSQRATSRIRSIARRSRRPDRAAWRRSTPSVF